MYVAEKTVIFVWNIYSYIVVIQEAIRKERERLRQEQEALQREREEHRRKLMLEQEELVKTQKSHGTFKRKFFTVAVILTVIPLSLYYLFSCLSKMHEWDTVC